MKYEAEYRGAEVPLSPVSTVPELYSDFEKIGSIDGRMRYMLGNIPHHQGHLTAGAVQAVRNGLSWDIVHPTQPITWEEPTILQSPSAAQITPFPEQQSNFDTFPAQPTPAVGKKRVDWDNFESPWTDNSSGVEQGRGELQMQPSFGFQTPFRMGKQFFVENSTSSNSALYFSTPGFNPGTDVTIGLATPSHTHGCRTMPYILD